MKKVFSMFLAVCIALTLVSCTLDTRSQPPTETETLPPAQTQSLTPTSAPSETASLETVESDVSELFNGKIAIIANPRDGWADWDKALSVISEYGEDKVILVEWPGNSEYDEMINTVTKLGNDLEIKAIIVNVINHGTTVVLEKLREMRKDILIVCYEPGMSQSVTDLTSTADLYWQQMNFRWAILWCNRLKN